MSHDLDEPKPFSQLALRRHLLTLTVAIFAFTLFPILAKAAPLDELSGTLSQTVSNVTNTVLNPINQVNNQVNGTIHQVENTVGNVVDQVKNPIDGINNAIQTFLSPFEQQFQQYIQAFNAFFQREFQRILGGIFGGEQPGQPGNNGTGQTSGTGAAVPTETGAMGIPDFEANHAAIDQQVIEGAQQGFAPAHLQPSDLFNLNPVPLAQSMKAEQDRAENRGFAASVVGKEGQAAMQQEAEAATHTLQAIQAKADEAQTMDITQDVMKNLTAMASQQSALQAGTYANLMALRQQEAANSLVNSNMSESVDEVNRTHHAESMAGAISVMRGAANVYLPGTETH